MCDNCVDFDEENTKWVGIACSCACAEENLNPLQDGAAICDDCKHRVKG